MNNKELFQIHNESDTIHQENPFVEELVQSIKEEEYWKRLILTKTPMMSVPREIIREEWPLNELRITHCNLSIVPPQIRNLRMLSKLYLAFNKLKTMPEEMGELTELRVLDLQNNQLETLPHSIGNLTNLRCLLLSENKLKSIPYTIGNLVDLNVLEFERNLIRKLPPEMCHLKDLTIWRITGNPLISPPPEIYYQKSYAQLRSYLQKQLEETIEVPDSILHVELEKLINDTSYSDLTLILNDSKELHLHCAILSAASPILEQMILARSNNNNNNNNNSSTTSKVIINLESKELDRCNVSALLDVIRFIYTGKLSISNHTDKQEAYIVMKNLQIDMTSEELLNQPPSSSSSSSHPLPITEQQTIQLNQLKKHVSKILYSQQFSDIRIYSEEGKCYFGHKFILSRPSCEYFNKILSSNMIESRSGEIHLDLPNSILEAILEFCYTDDIETMLQENPDAILDLFLAACRLGMNRLIHLCESIIGYNLDNDNVISIYILADDNGATKLRLCCERFIIGRLDIIQMSTAWSELSAERKEQLLKRSKELLEADEQEDLKRIEWEANPANFAQSPTQKIISNPQRTTVATPVATPLEAMSVDDLLELLDDSSTKEKQKKKQCIIQ